MTSGSSSSSKPSGDTSKNKTTADTINAQMPDPVKIANILARVSQHSHNIINEFLRKYGAQNDKGEIQMENLDLIKMSQEGFASSDPAHLAEAFASVGQKIAADPAQILKAQYEFMHKYWELLNSTSLRFLGEEVSPVIQPDRADRRFSDEAWSNNPWFDFVKQTYLLWSKSLQSSLTSVEGMDEKTAKKVEFYTRQYIDALSPSNFILTNPEVLRKTLETGGDNLMRGLENLVKDLERGEGKLAIKMSDETAFKVGENIAVTPGKVIFQNSLMQLIQYSPTTQKVAKAPLLVIPPWINKYYILDLSPKNSFIKWAVDQGQTVFVISWVNPTSEHRHKSFEDYMIEGPMAAMDAIEKAIGEKEFNLVGYCIGGTLLACLLAYMTAKGDTRAKSATFFTTLLDFSEPGDLGVFIDEQQIAALEEKMQEKGYLEGSEMATTFNLLRSNDLIWYFVINNYLMGQDPFPFDLLYWNSDSTRMPSTMHSFYLRNMYLLNKVIQPGGISLKGVPIDLRTIKTPAFFISTREDHIAPWKSCYAGARLFQGPINFVLAASGHIAGVVNHPDKAKYSHWINEGKTLPSSNPEEWFRQSAENPGSWWPYWSKWLKPFSNGDVAARDPAKGSLPSIEDAPGSYVKSKS